MARPPASGAPRLRVRRLFDPSRSQTRALAFAFEQALPTLRTPRPARAGRAAGDLPPADNGLDPTATRTGS